MTEEMIRRMAAVESVRTVLAVGYYAVLIAAVIMIAWNGWKLIQEEKIYRKMKEGMLE